MTIQYVNRVGTVQAAQKLQWVYKTLRNSAVPRSAYSYISQWPISTSPKRLSLMKFVTLLSLPQICKQNYKTRE